MKILIIGAGGMLGYVTFQYFQEMGYSVTGITKAKKIEGLYQLDATDEKLLTQFLEQRHFDAIINCAALLVRASEANKCVAIKLNAWLPHFLSKYCEKREIYFVQVSTDGVFSGMKGSYEEFMPSDAESFYGRSKFLGEVYTNALTVRSGFWGADVNVSGTGLFHWFMKQESMVTGYSRAFFNGVSNLEFARFVNKAVQEHWTGIYHLCAANPISKYDFLCLQKEIFFKNVDIYQDKSVFIDRTLKNTRSDIPYAQITFTQMMNGLKEWLQGRENFLHYFKREG